MDSQSQIANGHQGSPEGWRNLGRFLSPEIQHKVLSTPWPWLSGPELWVNPFLWFEVPRVCSILLLWPQNHATYQAFPFCFHCIPSVKKTLLNPSFYSLYSKNNSLTSWKFRLNFKGHILWATLTQPHYSHRSKKNKTAKTYEHLEDSFCISHLMPTEPDGGSMMLSPFYRWRSWGFGKLRNLSEDSRSEVDWNPGWCEHEVCGMTWACLSPLLLPFPLLHANVCPAPTLPAGTHHVKVWLEVDMRSKTLLYV